MHDRSAGSDEFERRAEKEAAMSHHVDSYPDYMYEIALDVVTAIPNCLYAKLRPRSLAQAIHHRRRQIPFGVGDALDIDDIHLHLIHCP